METIRIEILLKYFMKITHPTHFLWLFIEPSFHLLRLHFIKQNSLKIKTSNIKAELNFWPIFDDHWKQRGFYAVLSPFSSFLVITPIFCNSLYPKAITAFCEMHCFKRDFHTGLQKLNATFLSKVFLLRAWWISLFMLGLGWSWMELVLWQSHSVLKSPWT